LLQNTAAPVPCSRTSAAGQAGPFSIVSKVMHRLSQERSKLPFLASPPLK
jgi:hypothetical protein